MNPMNDLMDEIDEPLDEVQRLSWSLIDDCATEAEVQRLEQLLLESDDARRTYVLCMQMHADLHFLFNPKPRLPESLQKILDAEKAKTAKPAKTPPPLLNLPSDGAGIPLSSLFS